MAKKVTKVTTEVQRICKEQGVDKLYCNTKGEYFTNLSYAVASEGGDKKKVTTYTYDVVEEEEDAGKAAKEPEKTVKEPEKPGRKQADKVTDGGEKAEKTEEKVEGGEGDE